MFGKNEKFFIEDPRISFWIGVAAGVAVIAVIGFIVLLINFVSDDDKLAKADKSDGTAAEDMVVAGDEYPDAPTGPVDIKVIDQDNIRGNKDAKLTIVEFSDYQCSFCARFHETMNQVMEEYGDDVRWVYRHFPLDSIHPEARSAANAAECAGEQGKFWEFSDELFANQSSISKSYYGKLAQELGLNTAKFNDCVDSDKYANKINADYQSGVSAGVMGTPASFINGQLINGAQPYNTVKAAIDSLL